MGDETAVERAAPRSWHYADGFRSMVDGAWVRPSAVSSTMHCPFAVTRRLRSSTPLAAKVGKSGASRCLNAPSDSPLSRRRSCAADVSRAIAAASPSTKINCGPGCRRRWRNGPVSLEMIEAAVARICHKLRSLGEREIAARKVGEMVMKSCATWTKWATCFLPFTEFPDVEASAPKLIQLRRHRRGASRARISCRCCRARSEIDFRRGRRVSTNPTAL